MGIETLEPNKQISKELGEFRWRPANSTEALEENTAQQDEDRLLGTAKGVSIPLPNQYPELGDRRYGK